MLRAVSWPPLCDTMAFQACVTCCPAEYDQVSVQPLTGSPRLVMVMFTPNPPGHCEVTVYATEQPTVAACADMTTPMPARTVPATAATASRVRGRTEARIPGVLSTYGTQTYGTQQGARSVQDPDASHADRGHRH